MTHRRKPHERRREIADAVLKIIAERGIGRLTAATIAREVGVTDAALFHHFRGMDEILLAAIERVEELLFQNLPSGTGEPLDRLRDFFLQRLSAIHRHPGAGRLMLSDILVQIAPPSGSAKVRALKRRSVEFIRSCLLEAHRAGLLADGIEPSGATVMVLGSLMALTQAPDLVAGGGSIEAIGGTIWLNLERLLRRPSMAGAEPLLIPLSRRSRR
jgi:AcrR family transcriptional regulator